MKLIPISEKERERYKKLFRIVFQREPTKGEELRYMTSTFQRLKTLGQLGYEKSVKEKIKQLNPQLKYMITHPFFLSFEEIERRDKQEESQKALKKMSTLNPDIAKHILLLSGVKNATLTEMTKSKQLTSDSQPLLKAKKVQIREFLQNMIKVLREATGCKELRLGFNNICIHGEYIQMYGIYGIPVGNPISRFVHDIRYINDEKKQEFLKLFEIWKNKVNLGKNILHYLDSYSPQHMFLGLGKINQPYKLEKGEIVPNASSFFQNFSYDYDSDLMEPIMKNYSKSNLKEARRCFNDRQSHDKFNHLLTWEDQYLLSQERQERKVSKILGSVFFVVGTVMGWYSMNH